ncbi:hypothetical protein BUALT_Bualt07G0102700 [Buddleja alternifolia]|uniref:Uncharacterized protein n=1 Tax=Buddleja alternifolia TaxID=168488 RepID=A0AAV6XK88_9LAMI|nr:hypothetical protein BUALT_Bualt07G0102700 [Buddleja alternifolia]
MDKLLEFGRKAMFYVRVLSGYEEHRIRSYRIQLQQRLQQAQERKAALKKVPEQIIISEVRRMVEDMQSLNKKLEETSSNTDQVVFGSQSPAKEKLVTRMDSPIRML